MADKLSLFNGALRLCHQRKLSSLTESIEPRRLLDDAWGDGSTTGAVRYCLELGQWTFATRAVQIEASPSVEPDFGYRNAFDQPDDMVRVMAVCEDEYYNVPLLQYVDERRYWYADIDPIYVKYVSNGAEYGADLSLWPETFVKLIEAYLANEIVGNLTADKELKSEVRKMWGEALSRARSNDAMNKPTVFTPRGSWASARTGGRSDRGSRSRLIG